MFRWMIALALLASFACAGARAQDMAMPDDVFKRIPVLHEGRIKPLDTFARSYARQFFGGDSVGDASAAQWLQSMLFQPYDALDRLQLHIPSDAVISLLELEKRKSKRYGYREIKPRLKAYRKVLQAIAAQDPQKWTATQKALWNLYESMSAVVQIAEALSLMMPLEIELSNELKDELGIKPDNPMSYISLMRVREALDAKVKALAAIKGDELDLYNKQEQSQVLLSLALRALDQQGAGNQLLRVIPPAWQQEEQWFSLWGVINAGQGSPQLTDIVQGWQKMLLAYHAQDAQQFKAAANTVHEKALEVSGVSETVLELEVIYNQFNLIPKIIALYAVALLLLVVAFMRQEEGALVQWASRIMLGGFAAHLGVILLRIAVLGRPPVSTLYESILFVALVAVFYGLWLYYRRNTVEGLTIGSALGVLLLLVSGVYAGAGDTMGMLIAVLNTNFWLATHVVCITIGYGCTLVAGTLAHLALVQPEKDKTSLLVSTSIIALLFTAVGTILGGVWADQSWGRFWGWDPKENGALLIVLWLVWLLHGRMTKHIGRTGFAALLALSNVVVAVSWFGVNLLNVGLHSYGFTDAAAVGFVSFCAIELVLISLLYSWRRWKAVAA